MKISYDCSDQAVDELRGQGLDIYWKGYALGVFVPSNRALRNNSGQFRNGSWGFETTYEVDEKGYFNLPDSVGRSRFAE